MKKIALIGILVLLFSFAQLSGENYFEGKLNIKVQALFTSITSKNGIIETEQAWFNELAENYQINKLEPIFHVDYAPFNKWFHLEFPEVNEVMDVKNDFANQAEVLVSEPSYIFQLCEVPNDELYTYQWALPKIQAEDVWEIETGSEDIIIGVIDTGIDMGDPDTIPPFIDGPHDDLNANILKKENGEVFGHNYILNEFPENIPCDNNGHGTHVSGIIAAVTNNNIGVAGLAGGWGEIGGVKIMPVKVFPRSGGTPPNIVAAGIHWAADPDGDPNTDDGCDIINMSLGGPESSVVYDAIFFADGMGVLLVASAGNNSSEGTIVSYPAAYNEVIAVVSTDSTDLKSGFSNYGYWTDISAPGGYDLPLYRPENILSTTPHYPGFHYNEDYEPGDDLYMDINYSYACGTSMAAPYVVGLAALIKSYFPDSTNQFTRGRIFGTTDDIYPDNPDYHGKLGAGRINAFKALTESEHPNLCYQRYTIDDGNNGNFEYGETVNLIIELKNWWIEADSVQGTLQANDPYITIEDSIGSWGNIGQEEIVANYNDPFIISDNTVSPRAVDFTLHLEAENMEPRDIEFEVIVYPNTNTPFVDLSLGADETITTELVTSDFDLDGIDEVVVGAPNGNLYVYNHPDLDSLHTNAPINCTPAIGDINNDGYDEIIAGNDSGKVYIWDKDGNLISQYQVNGMCKHSIVLEDVTGDGQLEIIVSTWKYPGNATGMDGFYIIDPINGNVYSYDTYYRIQRPLSVADVNNDSKKELVVPLKNTYYGSTPGESFNHLIFFSVSSSYVIEEIWEISTHEINYLSGPILADIDEDGIVEILINFDWPEIYGSCNWLFAYHFGQDNAIWQIRLGNNMDSYIPRRQIVVGDFLDSVEGLEIVTSDYSYYYIIDCNGNLVNELYYNSSLPKPMVLSDIDSNGNQELLLVSLYSFLVLDDDTNYLEQWRINTSIINPFVSLSMGRVTEEYDNDIVLITQDGTIFAFPVDYSPTSISEWSQYQNNARNTGCYFQPLPEEIAQDITVKHNAVIDKEVRFSTMDVDASLIFEPGIEILFKPSGSILGRNVVAVGDENNLIKFAGLCADTTKEYWKGILMEKKSESYFKHCYLRNAYYSLLLKDIEKQKIENCTIENNNIGIFLYHSSPIIKENIITNNDYGIVGYHKSMPILSALDSPECRFRNAIVNNNVRDIFLDSSIPYLNNGFNDIYNTFGGFYIELVNYPDRFLKARRNYWGTTNIEEIYTHLDPADLFIIEPICEEPNTSYNPFSDPKYDLLKEAYSYLGNEDYVNAEISFKNLIETYPETQEADQSISGLFICYKESEGNWDEFETYINNLLNQPDISETTQKLLFSYLNLCKREKEEYDIAIASYESILENSPTYEDSCYAVIDIGNTYLEAGNGGKSISCKYPELIPVSAELHQQKSRELLNSILTGKHIHSHTPEISKFVLYQNYPNPYRFHTTISYAIPKSGTVSLKIYNIKGQLVKAIVNEYKEKGYYTEIWNGRNDNGKKLANGIYFYKIKIEGKSKVKKMLLLR